MKNIFIILSIALFFSLGCHKNNEKEHIKNETPASPLKEGQAGDNISDKNDNKSTAPLSASGSHLWPIMTLPIPHDADVNAVDQHKRTSLIYACEAGNADVVKGLIAAGARLNAEGDYGETSPLIAAVWHGHADIVKILLDAKVNVNDFNRISETALFFAARYGEEEIVKILLENGANVKATTYFGKTVLQEAAKGSNEKIVKMLLNAGASPNEGTELSPLAIAAENPETDIANILIKSGADINGNTGEYERNMFSTPLIMAATSNHIKLVKILLTKNVDINKRDFYYRRTALMYAAKHGNSVIAKMLIDKGAKIDVFNDDNISVAKSNIEIKKADVAKMGKSKKYFYTSWNALMYASSKGDPQAVKLLIDAGADVNAEALEYGSTALNFAVEGGRLSVETVKLLVEAGADVNTYGDDNCTPLLGLAYFLHDEKMEATSQIVKLLLENGADVDIKDDKGKTAEMVFSERKVTDYEKNYKNAIRKEKNGYILIITRG